MSFSASQRNINEVLSRSTIYNIPKNQRKYVWGEPEWNELFEDLFLIDQSDSYNHFLGSVVLAKEEENNQYTIIDGQQRFTTICILILAIINRLYAISQKKVGDSYKVNYLKVNDDGEDYYKIERKDGQPFFLWNIIDEVSEYRDHEYIVSKFNENFGASDKYNEKLLDCYLWFDSHIEEQLRSHGKKLDFLKQLKNKLTNCEVIEIIVDKDVDGYRVFETLNARGIPLEQHELIKNYLYSYLRSKSKIQKLDNTWEKIISNVTFNKVEYFSAFISHYCSHLYGKTKKNDEFKTIRANTNKSQVESLLNSLSSNSLYYSFILEPTKLKNTKYWNEKVALSLNYFRNLNIRQVRPLLLSLFEKYDESSISIEELQKCIESLEVFYFIYSTVLKNTSNTIDNSMITLAKKIHYSSNNHFVDEIKNELDKYISEKDKISINFKYLGYSNKNKKFKNSSNRKIVNYIFVKFEDYYDVNDEIDPTITSIEHIMNDDDSNDHSCYIGNLLPLSSRLNNKISSKAFIDKIPYYKRSKLLTVNAFLNDYSTQTTWTNTDIDNRGDLMASIAFSSIWVF